MKLICIQCQSENVLYTKTILDPVDKIVCHDCGAVTPIPEYRKYLAREEIKNGQ